MVDLISNLEYALSLQFVDRLELNRKILSDEKRKLKEELDTVGWQRRNCNPIEEIIWYLRRYMKIERRQLMRGRNKITLLEGMMMEEVGITITKTKWRIMDGSVQVHIEDGKMEVYI